MLDFWKRFDSVIKEKQMLQKEVYTRIDVSQGSFSRWRITDRLPPADKALAIAHILGVSLDFLINGVMNDSSYQAKEKIKAISNQLNQIANEL